MNDKVRVECPACSAEGVSEMYDSMPDNTESVLCCMCEGKGYWDMVPFTGIKSRPGITSVIHGFSMRFEVPPYIVTYEEFLAGKRPMRQPEPEWVRTVGEESKKNC